MIRLDLHSVHSIADSDEASRAKEANRCVRVAAGRGGGRNSRNDRLRAERDRSQQLSRICWQRADALMNDGIEMGGTADRQRMADELVHEERVAARLPRDLGRAFTGNVRS